MFLNLIVQSISETVAGGINSAEIDKRIRCLKREESPQREIAITNTQLAMEYDDDAGAPLTVIEKK